MKTFKQTEGGKKKKILAELEKLYPIAKGSLAEIRKPCVRPNCPACVSGRKHPAYIFSFKDKKRSRCMYVPLDLVPTMRRAIRNGRLFEERMGRLGAELILWFRQRRGQTASQGKKTARGKQNNEGRKN
jgi:hypothetical protein